MMINDWTSRYPSFRQIQMSQSASFSSFCSFLFSSSQQNTSFCDRTRRTAIYPRLNELRISISSLRNHHQQSPAFSFLPFLSFFSLALPVAWSCELNSHGQVLLAENKWRTLPPIVSFLKKKKSKPITTRWQSMHSDQSVECKPDLSSLCPSCLSSFLPLPSQTPAHGKAC